MLQFNAVCLKHRIPSSWKQVATQRVDASFTRADRYFHVLRKKQSQKQICLRGELEGSADLFRKMKPFLVPDDLYWSLPCWLFSLNEMCATFGHKFTGGNLWPKHRLKTRQRVKDTCWCPVPPMIQISDHRTSAVVKSQKRTYHLIILFTIPPFLHSIAQARMGSSLPAALWDVVLVRRVQGTEPQGTRGGRDFHLRELVVCRSFRLFLPEKGMKKVSGSCSMLVFGDVGFNDESDFEPVVFLMFHPCLVPLAKVWPFRRLWNLKKWSDSCATPT